MASLVSAAAAHVVLEGTILMRIPYAASAGVPLSKKFVVVNSNVDDLPDVMDACSNETTLGSAFKSNARAPVVGFVNAPTV
jgi:hypothetical protein